MTLSTPAQYRQALRRLDALLAVADAGEETQALVTALAQYETRLQHLPGLPVTLAEMIELKRQHLQLKQKELAQLLEVPAGRLSQILSGKRRVTLDLAKKLYERLGISPEFILKTA